MKSGGMSKNLCLNLMIMVSAISFSVIFIVYSYEINIEKNIIINRNNKILLNNLAEI